VSLGGEDGDVLDESVAQMRGVITVAVRGEEHAGGECRPLLIGKRGWGANRTGKRGVSAGAGRNRTRRYHSARAPINYDRVEGLHTWSRAGPYRPTSRVTMCDALF